MSDACTAVETERSSRTGAPLVLVVGNPNAGKSTLFNALTGGFARVGNFAGTTIDRKLGVLPLGGGLDVTLVDIPGTYSLAARSPEERIAIDSVLGLGHPSPDALVVVGDAPRLLRSLYLVLQLLELEVPLIFALNLMDEARAEGVAPDPEALSDALGVPVVPIVARSGEGLDRLREHLREVLAHPERATPGCPQEWSPTVTEDVARVVATVPDELKALAAGRPGRLRAIALWLLLSVDGDEALPGLPDGAREAVTTVRRDARAQGRDVEAELVGARYTWIDARAPRFLGGSVLTERVGRRTEAVDRVLLHPVWGSVTFLTVMAVMFSALFSWADPAIGLIEAAFGVVGDLVGGGTVAMQDAFPAGAGPIGILGDLVVDGLIGGVGSVLVFLPQIALLFLFLALLEDCGYLARAAHLTDRVLRAAGLPGQAFVPLLSGYACAVPAILATRTMPRARDRLLTMAVLPLTSCSARLPVYSLIIAALFPPDLGPLPLRPLALFGMYLFSTWMTVGAGIVLGRTVLRQEATPALIELPPYRIPDPRTVLRLVTDRCTDFVREAGQVILWATVALWVLLSFPRYEVEDLLSPEQIAAAEAAGQDLDNVAAPLALERSFAGHLGRMLEPTIAPLGYDWRIGIGLVGAFAAREVFVSTMGLVHGIGADADEESGALRDRMREETRPDGAPLYTPLVGTSLMVFFALGMQCLSTMAVLRKETRGWRWPTFVFVYMSALAWMAAFVVFQVGRILGLG